MRELKTYLAAVCAMFAVGAPTASAAEFHAASFPATLSGVQTTSHVFTFDLGTVTCNSVTFKGTASAKTSSTLTLAPTYGGCTAFGFINTPVHPNECVYTYQAFGTMELKCPAGKYIDITAPLCTVKISPFHREIGTGFAADGTHTVTKITSNTSGVPYDECGTKKTNGKYTGKADVGGSVAFWYE